MAMRAPISRWAGTARRTGSSGTKGTTLGAAPIWASAEAYHGCQDLKWADIDNDGDQDLFVVNGHAHFLQPMPCLLLENRGDGFFADAAAKGGPFFQTRLNRGDSGEEEG